MRLSSIHRRYLHRFHIVPLDISNAADNLQRDIPLFIASRQIAEWWLYSSLMNSVG